MRAHSLLINSILCSYLQYSSCILSIYPDSLCWRAEKSTGSFCKNHCNTYRTWDVCSFCLRLIYQLHFFASALLHYSSQLQHNLLFIACWCTKEEKLFLYMIKISIPNNYSNVLVYSLEKIKVGKKINISFTKARHFALLKINHSNPQDLHTMESCSKLLKTLSALT